MATEKLEFDRKFLKNGAFLLGGVDEAGRGCLAGPVVAAVVVFDYRSVPDLPVEDSKRLVPEERERLFTQILSNCVDWAVGAASWKRVDEINIRRASMFAMQMAFGNLRVRPHVALVDGNMDVRFFMIPTFNIIHGDSLSFAVASASIVAKVVRDRIMQRYHKIFPEYGFDRHKGYPTKFHKENIQKYGPCKIHRMSFLKWLTEEKREVKRKNWSASF